MTIYKSQISELSDSKLVLVEMFKCDVKLSDNLTYTGKSW